MTENDFFDDIERRIEELNKNPDFDNESTRHDRIVYPILTGIYGLNWNPSDLQSQRTISVPKQINDSHIFRGAVPKNRRPDILIRPSSHNINLAVIEEKEKQSNLHSLNENRIQVHEYQSLFECTWGVLTDGEHWIIKRNFETQLEFSSFSNLRKNFAELKYLLGKENLIKRLSVSKSSDLIIVISEKEIPKSGSSLPSTCEIYGFQNNIPVTVCGVEGERITDNGTGYMKFINLEGALRIFPDLHPRLNTPRFTWAMKELTDGNISGIRFETWKANEFYST